MPRYIVWLPPERGEKLAAIAAAQRRKPADELALIVERHLERVRRTKPAQPVAAQ